MSVVFVKEMPLLYSTVAKSCAKVTVDPWGQGPNDCLDAILKNQGYDDAPIYTKDHNGLNLMDRVVKVNKLRSADALNAGQTLLVPSTKEAPKLEEAAPKEEVAEAPQAPTAQPAAMNFVKAHAKFATEVNHFAEKMLKEYGDGEEISLEQLRAAILSSSLTDDQVFFGRTIIDAFDMIKNLSNDDFLGEKNVSLNDLKAVQNADEDTKVFIGRTYATNAEKRGIEDIRKLTTYEIRK